MKYLDKLQYNKDANEVLISYNLGINLSSKDINPDIDVVSQILNELDGNPELKSEFLSGAVLYFITEDNPISRKVYEMKDDSSVDEFRSKLSETSDLVYEDGGYYTHFFLEDNAIKAEELLSEYLK